VVDDFAGVDSQLFCAGVDRRRADVAVSQSEGVEAGEAGSFRGVVMTVVAGEVGVPRGGCWWS
jgi:hypothetical protein